MAIDGLPRFGRQLAARSQQLADAAARKRLDHIARELGQLAPLAEIQRDTARGQIAVRAPNIARRAYDEAEFHLIGRGISDG
jgi:hypothetical protein